MFFLRETFAFPPDLASALEKALPRGKGAALRALWPKLARGRGQVAEGEQHYSFRRDEAEAYAAYYLPANCLKPALVLEESWQLGMDPVPGDAVWLDCGTGPGTAYWGISWWCARRGKKLRFTGWDQSPQFTSIARALAPGAEFLTAGARVASDAGGAGGAGGEDPLALVRRLRPTHVSFMNSIAEIYPDESVREREVAKILHALSELEKKDGKPRFLLLIEPGSRESSRELASLKDKLGGALLPCLDDRPCGALRDPKDWCHEEAACEFPPWLNELGAEAGLRKESMLFSYAWIRAGASLGPLKGCSRIVSQRMERKGQVECRLCTPEGKRAVRVQRSKTTPASEFFLESVRGELWRSAEIGEKGDVAGADVVKPGKDPIF